MGTEGLQIIFFSCMAKKREQTCHGESKTEAGTAASLRRKLVDWTSGMAKKVTIG